MSVRQPIHSALLLGCGALALAVGFGALRANTAPRDNQTAHSSVGYGPDAQAAATRGEGVYIARCASCHGSDLGGGGHIPALHGEGFMGAWRGMPMRAIYSRTISTMPWNDPGTLSEANTLDLVAFIAKRNSIPFPEGVSRPDQLNDLRLIEAAVAAAPQAVDEDDATDGAQVYMRCAACHLPNGAGVPAAFPPLRTDLVALAKAPVGRRYLALAISKGLAGPLVVEGHSFNGAMPPQQLDDKSVAAVLNHLLFVINESEDQQRFTASEVAAALENGADLRPADVAKMRTTALQE